MNIAFPAFASELNFTKKTKGRSSCPFVSENKVLERIASEGLSLKYLGFAEEYKGSYTKIAFECGDCGEIWDNTTVNNFIHYKTKCPCHRKVACSNGLKKKAEENAKKRLPSVPTFYIMKFVDPINGQQIGKIGYSKNPEQRKQRLTNANKLKLEIIYTHRFENGYGANSLENYIKKELQTGVIDSDTITEGFSETFAYTNENVSRIKSLINLHSYNFYRG